MGRPQSGGPRSISRVVAERRRRLLRPRSAPGVGYDVHGGMKFYRGSPAAARAYVEADHSRADDYYLAEGSGVATRYVADVDPKTSTTVRNASQMDGPSYEQWVAGRDPETGAPKGRLRHDDNALRFVEVTVNGPKTWSLAAALHPEISAALDAAQDRAAEQIISWSAEHATTRLGPRGRQVQVPVAQLEAAVIRHYTSRAGDPHRHLHLQINARVLVAAGPTGQLRWRGLHSIGMRDFLGAINGIGHAAVATDPEFRTVLAEHGYTLDPATGELRELEPYAARFSARTAQIGCNIDRYEAEWRAQHPGQEPGPRLRQAWDRRAWATARPDKVVPKDGAAMVTAWNEELQRLGFRPPLTQAHVHSTPVGMLDRDEGAELVLSRLGAQRSSWNAADIRGQVEHWITESGVVATAGVRQELAEDVTARAISASTSLFRRPDVPEHVRALSSAYVIAVEDAITTTLAELAAKAGSPARLNRLLVHHLDRAQRSAVALLGGTSRLVVVEGAAGAGKTSTLAATRETLLQYRHQMLVVTPTLKGAQVVRDEIDAPAFSAAWLVHQWGFRWDDDGHWTHTPTHPDPRAHLQRGDLLVVDEAGMLDQDTASALLAIVQHCDARVAFIGDRHQLPAVGRGGVLDLVAAHAGPGRTVSLDVVHRFADPEYARISLAMRTGSTVTTEPADSTDESVFDALARRGQIRLHATESERTDAMAHDTAVAIMGEHRDFAVMADTREQTSALNEAVRTTLVAQGHVDDSRVVTNAAGQRLGVGDRVVTRRNDAHLAVANRQTWTVTEVGDSTLVVRNHHGLVRDLPLDYAHQWVEHAYATTVHGAQEVNRCRPPTRAPQRRCSASTRQRPTSTSPPGGCQKPYDSARSAAPASANTSASAWSTSKNSSPPANSPSPTRSSPSSEITVGPASDRAANEA